MRIDNSDDFVEKIQNLQRIVWDIDEKVKRNLEAVAEQQLDIVEIKSSLEVVEKELTKLKDKFENLGKRTRRTHPTR